MPEIWLLYNPTDKELLNSVIEDFSEMLTWQTAIIERGFFRLAAYDELHEILVDDSEWLIYRIEREDIKQAWREVMAGSTLSVEEMWHEIDKE